MPSIPSGSRPSRRWMSFVRKAQSRAKLNAQAAFIHKAVPALWRGLLRVSKKWLNATFLSFTGFASRKKHEVPPRETGRN